MNKKILKYVSQSVLGMIGVSVYILADTYFISYGFGADGLTVLNLILPIYGLIYAIGQMLGLGFAVSYSLDKGRGESTDGYFLAAIRWCLIMSLPFVLLGAFLPEQLLGMMGADPVLAEMGKNYVRLIMCGSPLFMMNYVLLAFARNDHATGIAMVGALAGSFYNIVFDYVFMFPLGFGFPGAALATVGCPVISMLICLTHYISPKNTVGMKMENLNPHLLRRSSALGMSGFVGEFSFAVTSLVFNFMTLTLAGNVGVAAYGVIANIALVCTCIFNGVAQGMQPLISRSYAKGEKAEVASLLRTGLLIMFVTSALFLLLGILFAEPMVGIFNSQKDEALAYYAVPGLRLYFTGFLIAGVNVYLIAYYSATGREKPVMIGSILRGMVLIAGFAVLFGFLFGMNGIWLSYLAAEAGTLLVLLMMQRVSRDALK